MYPRLTSEIPTYGPNPNIKSKERIIIFYRIKQFCLAITAEVSEEEEDFVASYLTLQEQELFYRLQVSEQKHCVNVASGIKSESLSVNKEHLIRLGLLHDIGKIKVKLTPIDKAIIVVLDKLSGGKLKKYSRYKKVNSYYNHGEIGYEILKEIAGYDPLFLQTIKNHHGEASKDNKPLQILQKWDDRN